MVLRSRFVLIGWMALTLLATCGCPSSSEPAKPDPPVKPEAVTETQPSGPQLPQQGNPASPGSNEPPAATPQPGDAAADGVSQDASSPPLFDPLAGLPLDGNNAEPKDPNLQTVDPGRPIGQLDPAEEPGRLPVDPLPISSVPYDEPRETSPATRQTPDRSDIGATTVPSDAAPATDALNPPKDKPADPMFQRHELSPDARDTWDPAKREPAAFAPGDGPEPPQTDVPGKPAVKDKPLAEEGSGAANIAENAEPSATVGKTPARPGKKGGPPFDPIKENGPIFVGWPKPKLALILTGRQEGYIEPCGCAGLDRMKGGMSRRYSLFEAMRAKGWPVVGLDVGSVSKGFGRQAELKFHTMIEGMRKTGFDAIGLGANELQLPAADLVSVAACADGQQGLFVSANVGLFGFAADVTPKVKYIKAGGMTVGVTSILGAKYQKLVRNDEVEMSDPATALAEVLVDMKKKADYLVLLSDATREESERLASKFPEFNIVVSAGDAAEPPSKPALVGDTKTMLIEVGEKGMCAVVVGLYDDPLSPVRYQRVPIDARFPHSEPMKALMSAYQDQLKTLGFAGLNIHSVPHPQADMNGGFVGSQKCESCHEKSYAVWRRSLHSKAYETLANLDPPRQFDPECISCHVVGWHPTRHFPYETGFRSIETTPQLTEVGCEDCHGPGEAHCNAEMGKDVALQKKLQKAMVVTKEESEKRQCYTCHDLDNSPAFDFKTYWPFIDHKEKEDEQ